MEISETIYVTNRRDWRKWLAKNHKDATEIWLVYYKKATGKPSIPYEEAVEEALCFGWIDSIEKRLDEERYVQRFTPRRPKSNWSELNIKRMQRLIREGRVTPAGFNAYKSR